MTAVTYPYASGDLLEDRHTYFYSEYGGRAFLNAWRRQRNAVRDTMPAAAEPPAGRTHRLSAETTDTDALLDHLFAAAADGRADDAENRGWLAKLVKKFEVTKRIHRAYGPSFRAVDVADHKDTTRYLRLAEVFEAAYRATGRLPYLNALLKCMDTLSALTERLPVAARGRLTRLIGCEREHVARLAETVGVAP